MICVPLMVSPASPAGSGGRLEIGVFPTLSEVRLGGRSGRTLRLLFEVREEEEGDDGKEGKEGKVLITM